MGYDVNAGCSLVYERKYPSRQFVSAALRQFQNRLRNKEVWVSSELLEQGIAYMASKDVTYIRVLRRDEPSSIAEIIEISYRVGDEILTDYWEAYDVGHGAKTPLAGEVSDFTLDTPLERSRRIWTAAPVGSDIHHPTFRLRVHSELVVRGAENFSAIAARALDIFKAKSRRLETNPL